MSNSEEMNERVPRTRKVPSSEYHNCKLMSGKGPTLSISLSVTREKGRRPIGSPAGLLQKTS